MLNKKYNKNNDNLFIMVIFKNKNQSCILNFLLLEKSIVNKKK